MTEEEFKEALLRIDKYWPFKRIVATQEILDKINEELGTTFVSLAITVKKEVEYTEEEIFDTFLKWASYPLPNAD